MWKVKLFKPPEGGLTVEKMKALVPTATLHLIAHVSACASYNLSSVSFMQVVKAAEPACSVILLTLFFGARYSKWQGLTLVPISAQLEILCPPCNPTSLMNVSWSCSS
jgi:solute carrier family 35 protein E1